MLKAIYTWDNVTASRKRTRIKRYNEESWQAGPNTGISSKDTLPSAWRDRCTTPVCCQLWYNGAETWTLTKHAQNKRATAQTKMERSMLNITYKDRKTNVWVRERTKSYIYNQHCKKTEMVLGRAYQPPQRRPMDLACYHLETTMTRKGDEGDQPSGGETAWTNTGASRSGRGQHKAG